jgi:hypothetical protein
MDALSVIDIGWMLEAHACNLSYLGGSQVSSEIPISKNNQSKMDWRCTAQVVSTKPCVQTPLPPKK